MGETITFADRLKMVWFTLTAKKFTFGEKVKKFEKEWGEWIHHRNANSVKLHVSPSGITKTNNAGLPSVKRVASR
jgi:hypothetical protein